MASESLFDLQIHKFLYETALGYSDDSHANDRGFATFEETVTGVSKISKYRPFILSKFNSRKIGAGETCPVESTLGVEPSN